MTNINLPEVINDTSTYLVDITKALNVPRSIVASDEEISEAWERLPRVISKIPKNLRTKGIAKMCIAVSTGLFDSGINYVWNESIVELRNKVKRFGLSIVGEIIDKKDFDERKLNDYKDSELINLCLKLNLITEEGFFYLDQCRDIRNNFSVAHPTIGDVDENELISFSNRCVKYALSVDGNPVGVNLGQFIESLKRSKFSEEQMKTWLEKISQTHEAQRELLFSTLYSMYCDKESTEETRVNSMNIIIELKDYITPTVKSNLINSHQGYIISGNTGASTASQQFFEKLALLELLGEKEKHAIIYKACDNLYDVHTSMNNFYNEPPFAERLYEITNGTSIPDTIKEKFVEVVILCGMGNGYGVSNRAFPFYEKIVSNFSPKELKLLFEYIADDKSNVGRILKFGQSRKGYLKQLIGHIDSSSVPTNVKNIYEKWK